LRGAALSVLLTGQDALAEIIFNGLLLFLGVLLLGFALWLGRDSIVRGHRRRTFAVAAIAAQVVVALRLHLLAVTLGPHAGYGESWVDEMLAGGSSLIFPFLAPQYVSLSGLNVWLYLWAFQLLLIDLLPLPRGVTSSREAGVK
jgi:hypothetical protein